MKKKLIIRIAEGLGNQLFMYANGYQLSKDFDCELYIDSKSGYFKKKNQVRSYDLDKFKIPINIPNNNLLFNNYITDLKRKLFKKINPFLKKKKFLLEAIDEKKKTSFKTIDLDNYSDQIFIEGHFESEQYFSKYRNDLVKLFTVKNDLIDLKNIYIDKLKETNSVSICIRQHRFSEGLFKNDQKSNHFLIETINYINKSITFFKKKIENPKFFIWSNDFTNIDNYFNPNEFIYIKNNYNKSLNDFNLFRYSKHFIVGPTSFHWWGAWLNNNPKKICVRPSNINPSNNIDFWPKHWISI